MEPGSSLAEGVPAAAKSHGEVKHSVAAAHQWWLTLCSDLSSYTDVQPGLTTGDR